jgi:hypothetical protein
MGVIERVGVHATFAAGISAAGHSIFRTDAKIVWPDLIGNMLLFGRLLFTNPIFPKPAQR